MINIINLNFKKMKNLVFALLLVLLVAPILLNVGCNKKDEIVTPIPLKVVYPQDPLLFGNWISSDKKIKLYFGKDTMSYLVSPDNGLSYYQRTPYKNWSYSNGTLCFYDEFDVQQNIYTITFSDIALRMNPFILFKVK